jgi:hypothetical protein
MNVMQYPITLPADYNMGIIRTRVATRGHMLDALPGLTLKAYCIQERGVDGLINQYAPFYLWHEVGAMLGFLRGAGFRAVCDSFGTPMVQHWVALDTRPPTERGVTPRWATRRSWMLAEQGDVQLQMDEALSAAHELWRTDTPYASVVALDPRRWELIQFSLWAEEPPPRAEMRYQVLHCSTPLLASRP